jgi:hypothetical protein
MVRTSESGLELRRQSRVLIDAALSTRLKTLRDQSRAETSDVGSTGLYSNSVMSENINVAQT